MPVSYRDIQDAFLCIAGDDGSEAVLDRETGQIFHRSELLGETDEGFPDEDALDSRRYVSLPNRRDLDLGSRLVMRFAGECLSNQDADEVHRIFERKGAYARFDDFLLRRDLRDRWHEFENAAEEKSLREWCGEMDIELAD